MNRHDQCVFAFYDVITQRTRQCEDIEIVLVIFVKERKKEIHTKIIFY